MAAPVHLDLENKELLLQLAFDLQFMIRRVLLGMLDMGTVIESNDKKIQVLNEQEVEYIRSYAYGKINIKGLDKNFAQISVRTILQTLSKYSSANDAEVDYYSRSLAAWVLQSNQPDGHDAVKATIVELWGKMPPDWNRVLTVARRIRKSGREDVLWDWWIIGVLRYMELDKQGDYNEEEQNEVDVIQRYIEGNRL